MTQIHKSHAGGNIEAMSKKPVAGFRRPGSTEPTTVRGQTARSLVALHHAGQRGITALELSSWAFRLAHYIMELRRLGLEIETVREQHPGGWHGRYVLHSEIELTFFEDR